MKRIAIWSCMAVLLAVTGVAIARANSRGWHGFVFCSEFLKQTCDFGEDPGGKGTLQNEDLHDSFESRTANEGGRTAISLA